MKKLFLLFTTMFIATVAFSQTQDIAKDSTDKFKSIIKTNDSSLVQIFPEFPGGLEAWNKFLSENINTDVPVKKGAPTGNYMVEIIFNVDTTGKLNGFVIKNDLGYGMAQEVIRVLKRSPKWKSGTQNGKKVNCKQEQPVIFNVLQEE